MKNINKLSWMACMAALIFLAGCGKEYMTEANNVFIMNPDTAAVEIFVNGEKAIDFSGIAENLYLNSGTYELVAKRGGAEISKASVSMSRKSESTQYDQIIWDLKGGRNFAVLDVRNAYWDNYPLAVEQTYNGENVLYFDCDTYHFYMPWRNLPMTVYANEGSTASVYKLFELPADKKNMSDEEIIKWVEENGAF